MRKCRKCGNKIPKERLEVLPDTKTCVRCSQVNPKMGLMVWDKFTPELIVVENEEDADRFHELEKMEGRLERF